MTDPRDSKDFTPMQIMLEAVEDLRLPAHNKALVILLKDTDGDYFTSFRNAGMSATEAIALLARMQHKLQLEQDATEK